MNCKSRSTVTDSSGNIWDLANPNIIGIKSASGGTSTSLVLPSTEVIISVAFTAASSVFTNT